MRRGWCLNYAGLTLTVASSMMSARFCQAGAQARALSGIVTDSLASPIAGTEVSIAGTSLRAVSNENGQFHFSAVPAGMLTVNARRLGFRPASVSSVSAENGNAELRVEMKSLPQVLKPVVVSRPNPKFNGRLAGFYERLRRKAGGYYVTQEEIDRDNPRSLTAMLQRFPAVTIFRHRGGATGIRFRGRTCRPLVWLDGFPMPAGEVDLDSFSPQGIHGVEMYLGFSTPPARYLSSSEASRCGTILLWSRGPDTDPRFAVREVVPAPDLASLPGSIQVYTAEQVDKPAIPVEAEPAVDYPPMLLAQRVGGRVVVGYVIGRTGRVEDETVGVISSTHPLFTEAVREALRRWFFTPATRQDVAVRQWVNQSFQFSPGGESRRNNSGKPNKSF